MTIPALYLWIAASAIVAYLGRGRKFGFWGYFFASLLLTPLIGALLVLASGTPAEVGAKDGG
mgnify:CR=1 FL=1